MRNLKKVLSLALAMVMLLGMMVVGAGAATEFKDASSIPENREVAVAVANAIEVLLGDENGNFNPDATLTRAEAAVVLTKLDLGADAAKALVPTDAASFDDVGAGYGWAKAYIDYCAGNGYMVGVGGNRFAPAQTLTSVEFGLMVSRVLGYRDANENIKGDNWMVTAAALARKAGLGTDVAIANAPMTRADMAQMVLNALTAPMVEYEGLDITIGDVAITSKAKVRTHTGSSLGSDVSNTTYDYGEIDANITPIRLCEEKFPTLKLRRTGSADEFGRTYSVWTLKNLDIDGTKVVVGVDHEFTAETSETDVRTEINGATSNGDNVPVYTNGQEGSAVVNAAYIADKTDNGRLVQVYMNGNNKKLIEKVVIIDTALAEVTKVVDSEETISVKLVANKTLDKDGNYTKTDKIAISNVVLNTKVGYGEVKVGDLVLVQGYYNSSKTPEIRLNKDTKVTSVELATKVDGFATVKKYDSQNEATYITVNGEDYYDACGVMENFAVNDFDLNTEFDSTLYLDQYGYIMKAIEGKDPKAVADNLIAVKRAYSTLKDGEIVRMVEGVISNGETISLAVNGTESALKAKVNMIQTYTKNNNGKYDLNDVADRSSVKIDKDTKDAYVSEAYNAADITALGENAKLTFRASDVYGKVKNGATNVMYSDTVKFIFVDNRGDKPEGVTVISGRQNYTFDRQDGDVLAQALNTKGEIIAVYISAKADVADISDIIYVHSRNREWDEVITRDDGTRVQYYGYKAYTSDGTEIDHFLGVNNGMANQFFVADQNSDKAYKDTKRGMLDNHTNVNGVVKKANGMSGDAFLLAEFDADTGKATGNVFEFLGRASTPVKDLTDAKLYIESVSELNDAVNSGRKITVAVIYNDTEAEAVVGTDGTKVKDPKMIYVIGVGAPGSYNDVDWGNGNVPGATYTVSVSGSTDNMSYTIKSGNTTSTNDKLTVNSGASATVTFKADAGYVFTENNRTTYTVTLNNVTADQTVAAPTVKRGVETIDLAIQLGDGVSYIEIDSTRYSTGANISQNKGTVLVVKAYDGSGNQITGAGNVFAQFQSANSSTTNVNIDLTSNNTFIVTLNENGTLFVTANSADVAQAAFQDAKARIESRTFDLYYKVEDDPSLMRGAGIQYFDNAAGRVEGKSWSSIQHYKENEGNGISYPIDDVDGDGKFVNLALTDYLMKLTYDEGDGYELNPAVTASPIGMSTDGATGWGPVVGPTQVGNSLEFTKQVVIFGKTAGTLDTTNEIGRITVKYKLTEVAGQPEDWQAPAAPDATGATGVGNASGKTITITAGTGVTWKAGVYRLYAANGTALAGPVKLVLAADGTSLAFTGVEGLTAGTTSYKIAYYGDENGYRDASDLSAAVAVTIS